MINVLYRVVCMSMVYTVLVCVSVHVTLDTVHNASYMIVFMHPASCILCALVVHAHLFTADSRTYAIEKQLGLKSQV